jgi:L-ascorbate metabolism protein UlaG (beta-lactamase superfamily)
VPGFRKQHRAFFGGDGGYYPGFAQIGRQHGPFDLTMLEIGAWHPNWGSIHLGTGNALKALHDLGGRHLLPIHWGVFNLSLHAWDEPITTLTELAPSTDACLVVPKPGERIDMKRVPVVTPWWKGGSRSS